MVFFFFLKHCIFCSIIKGWMKDSCIRAAAEPTSQEKRLSILEANVAEPRLSIGDVEDVTGSAHVQPSTLRSVLSL